MEQSTKRTRFEQAVTTWGQLESMPDEMKLAILNKLPLNDLIIMQQVSKSSYEYIESENLIQKWFDTYLGSNKLATSWILQKLIGRSNFSLEHVTGDTHVFVTHQTLRTITLRIEDDESEHLYNTIMSIATTLNMTRSRSRYTWICQVQNTRAGLTFIYNYLYRIMNMHEMLPNPNVIDNDKLEALEEMPRKDQIKTTKFDLFYTLDPSKEWLLEWERLHFGPNDRMRQLIMFYLAFEKKFIFVTRKGIPAVILEWKEHHPLQKSSFHVTLKNEFMTDSLLDIIVGGSLDERVPGWMKMWIITNSKYHTRLISIMYDWMTRGALRLTDFEGSGGRVLK
jgi:hypothetical protein